MQGPGPGVSRLVFDAGPSTTDIFPPVPVLFINFQGVHATKPGGAYTIIPQLLQYGGKSA